MIKTILIAWALNSHGAGVVIEMPFDSLAACYATVGRIPPPAGTLAACVPSVDMAGAVAKLNANRCDAHEPIGTRGIVHYCKGAE